VTLTLEKSSWKRVALRDVVRHITDRVDAQTSGLKRFLAGEHIPSASLAITSWGVVGKDPIGPMFYKRFEPGHVLYVSRRTYLRKVSVPDFDGITGEKTFVLETIDPSALLQEFLPFVLSAERFHAYALANSRGSVNPYLNWGELADYQFALPPVDAQKRIADLLWAIEHHKRALAKTVEVAVGDELKDPRSARSALLTRLLDSAEDTWGSKPLGEIGTFARGKRFTKADYVDSGISCIHYGQIYTDFSELASEAVAFLPESLRPNLKFAQPGDVVISGTSETIEDVAKAVAWLGAEPAAVHDDCFIFSHELDPRFAAYVFGSQIVLRQKIKFRSESKVVRISSANLAKITVPVPPIEQQRQIAGVIEQFAYIQRALLKEDAELAAVRASLMSQIFGGS
jgi:type I restriction enzyme S subunit